MVEEPKKAVARQLREIADLVERRGLEDGDIDIEDKAEFVKGEEMAVRRYTHVVMDLKIKRA